MEKVALLVIDVQKGFDDPRWGQRNNPDAESNIALLISAWRNRQLPIIHIRHCSVEPDSPLRPELPGNAFKEEAQPLPEEKQFDKSTASAFPQRISMPLRTSFFRYDDSTLLISSTVLVSSPLGSSL